MSMGSNILLEDVAKLRMNNKQLRDEVARLRAFIQRVGHPQWCSGFMTRNIDACTCGYYAIIPLVQAALTPQGGDKDAELQAYKQWESDMFCDEKAGWEHSKMNPRTIADPHGGEHELGRAGHGWADGADVVSDCKPVVIGRREHE